MGKPFFRLSFSIGPTNDERYGALALYEEAFGAKMLSVSTPPDGGDAHILMNVHGLEILISPGKAPQTGEENRLWCEVHYDDRAEMMRAYEALTHECISQSLEGPYPWATALGLVTDRYGISWALYYHE